MSIRTSATAALLLLFLVVISATPGNRAFASEQRNWVIVDTVGHVRLMGQVRRLEPGDVLPPNQALITEAGAQATLVQGEDLMVVYGNSRVEVPQEPEGSSVTRIFHRLGEVLFDVTPRASRSFQVESPLLIAGIKGTRFSVIVDDQGSRLSVIEGHVEVSSRDSEEATSVTTGLTVAVASPDAPPPPAEPMTPELVAALDQRSQALEAVDDQVRDLEEATGTSVEELEQAAVDPQEIDLDGLTERNLPEESELVDDVEDDADDADQAASDAEAAAQQEASDAESAARQAAADAESAADTSGSDSGSDTSGELDTLDTSLGVTKNSYTSTTSGLGGVGSGGNGGGSVSGSDTSGSGSGGDSSGSGSGGDSGGDSSDQAASHAEAAAQQEASDAESAAQQAASDAESAAQQAAPDAEQ